jgi:surface antigen
MRWLLILALLPCAVWANSICNFKEQTLLTNEEDQQVVSKHRVDTCIEKNSTVEYGLSSKCGVPRQIDPYHPAETIACQLDDGTWQQHNVFYSIDQYGKKTEITELAAPDTASVYSNDLVQVLIAKLFGKRLNDDQKYLHYTAIKSSLEQSSNGQGHQWQSNDMIGVVTVVATFQTSQGYCKILNTAVRTGNRQVVDAHRACYDNGTDNWYWVDDK